MFASTFTSGYSAQNVRENDFDGDDLLEDSETRNGLNGTLFGRFAGDGNSGENVTAIGYQSLQNNQGNNNTAVGYSAALGNRAGKDNTFVGARAGENNTQGDNNLFIGVQSGLDNQSGTWNMFIGNLSGRRVANERFNMIIGHQSCLSSAYLENTITLGYKSDCVNACNILLGNTSCNYAESHGLLLGHHSLIANDVSNNVVFGNNTTNTRDAQISVGNSTCNDGNRAIVIGHGVTQSNEGACILKTQREPWVLPENEKYKDALIFNDVLLASPRDYEIRAQRFLFSNTGAADVVAFESNDILLSVRDRTCSLRLTPQHMTFVGDATFENGLGVDGTLVVNDLRYNNNFEISRNLFVENSMFLGSNLALSNDLFVDRHVYARGDLYVDQKAAFRGVSEFARDVTMSNDLIVQSNITASSLNIDTFNIRDLTVASNLDIRGTSVFEENARFESDVVFSNDVACLATCDIARDLSVDGELTCRQRIETPRVDVTQRASTSNLVVRDHVYINSNVYIACPLRVSGSSRMENDVRLLRDLDVEGHTRLFSQTDIHDVLRLDNPYSNVDLVCVHDIDVRGSGFFGSNIDIAQDVFCGRRLHVRDKIDCENELSVGGKSAFAGSCLFCNDTEFRAPMRLRSDMRIMTGNIYTDALDVFSTPLDSARISMKKPCQFSNEVVFFSDLTIVADRSNDQRFRTEIEMQCENDVFFKSDVFADREIFIRDSLSVSNDVRAYGAMYAPALYVQDDVLSVNANAMDIMVEANFRSNAIFSQECIFSHDTTFLGSIRAPTAQPSVLRAAHIDTLSNQAFFCSNAEVDVLVIPESETPSRIHNVNIQDLVSSNVSIDRAFLKEAQASNLTGSNLSASNLFIADIQCETIASASISNTAAIDTERINAFDVVASHEISAERAVAVQMSVSNALTAQSLVSDDATHSNVFTSNVFAEKMLDIGLITADVLSNIDAMYVNRAVFEEATINDDFLTPRINASNMVSSNIEVEAAYVVSLRCSNARVSNITADTSILHSMTSSNASTSNHHSENIYFSLLEGDNAIIKEHLSAPVATIPTVNVETLSNTVLNTVNLDTTTANISNRMTASEIFVTDELNFSTQAVVNLNENTTYNKIDTPSLIADRVTTRGDLLVKNKYIRMSISASHTIDVDPDGYYFVPFDQIDRQHGTQGLETDAFNAFIFRVTQTGVYVLNAYLELSEPVCSTGWLGVLVSRDRNDSPGNLSKIVQEKRHKLHDGAPAAALDMHFHVYLEENDNVFLVARYDTAADSNVEHTQGVFDASACFCVCYLAYMLSS